MTVRRALLRTINTLVTSAEAVRKHAARLHGPVVAPSASGWADLTPSGKRPAKIARPRSMTHRLPSDHSAETARANEITREQMRSAGLPLPQARPLERLPRANTRSIRSEAYSRGMTPPNKRTVTPHPNGWSVEKPGASRASSVHDTQQQAIAAARHTLAASGGGELAVKGRDGRVRAQDTIPPGSDPRRSRG